MHLLMFQGLLDFASVTRSLVWRVQMDVKKLMFHTVNSSTTANNDLSGRIGQNSVLVSAELAKSMA